MKNNLLLLLICCCMGNVIYGQNLVLNPDFESYFDCPDTEGNFNLDNWEVVGGSCDYFHVCSDNSSPYVTDVPDNWAGYQLPNSGEGYAGAAAYAYEPMNTDVINIREYFAAELSEPLTVGTTYYVSAMVSLANGSTEAVNNLGFKFIKENLLDGPIFDNPVMDNFAHIHIGEIISDSMDWVMISGSFVADDNYPYMAIGNFFDDANTDTLYIQDLTQIGNEVAFFAYYYYDDVCVSTQPGFCFEIPTTIGSDPEISNITLNPNPARQTLSFENIDAVDLITVTDLMGRTQIQVQAQSQIDVEQLVPGVYFIQFHNEDNRSTKTLKFIKE